jgi:alkyldihydroxyacetonephosphate synthase
MKDEEFFPDWIHEAPAAGSYRSIFKWGDPLGFKHPNKRLYRMMKKVFHLSDEHFKKPVSTGNDPVDLGGRPVLIDRPHIEKLKEISGSENVSTADYDRLKYSTGMTVEEAMELRQKKIAEVCDVVVHPRNKEEVAKIVAYCDAQSLPLYVYGGGSGVNFGVRPAKGGVTLVMMTHMNRLLELDEKNQTARVEAGIFGPEYERLLNNAPELYGTKRRYTNGHFPQSFEHSSVGGWVVTLGSGQQSTYYGDIYDLVAAVEIVTPRGIIKTLPYAATATGPKVKDMIVGSEGTFGVVTEVTMKIFRFMPKNQFRFSFIFPTWEASVEAVREISQGEFGLPGVLRLSDPEETDVALKLYGVEGTILDSLMSVRGFKPMKRCLLIGRTEGERGFSRHVLRMSKRICRAHGGMSLSGYPVKSWEHGRFRDPYLREDAGDYDLIIDTLECSVTWENLERVYKGVRGYVKGRPHTVCMTHASHFYPQGTNLYFIYYCLMSDLEEYRKFQAGVFDSIVKHGGSLSHHHGVGRMIAPWMEEHLGKEQVDVIRALKHHFDPRGIMNPGGQLGLDLNASVLKNKDWRINWKSE